MSVLQQTQVSIRHAQVSLATHIRALLFGCPQTWWSAQWAWKLVYDNYDYEHGYFSFCLFKCRWVDFSQEQNQILRLQTNFHQFQTWLLPGRRKMLTSGIFQHKMVSQCWWALQFYWTHMIYCCYGRCLSQCFMALWYYWQMLLPYCHNIATFIFVGWCCSLVALISSKDSDVFTIRLMFFALLVDVITIIVVVDITTLMTVALECVPLVFTLFWLMLLPQECCWQML